VPSPKLLYRPGHFRQVIVVTGHMTDAPERAQPRFPESQVPIVRQHVNELFDAWTLDSQDLVICGGARGSDLICAELARVRGATVWMLLARPVRDFADESVAGSEGGWIDAFYDALQRCPSWDLSQLGPVPQGDEVFVRTNEWMLDVAEAQATIGPPIVLAIWDQLSAPSAGGSGDLVAKARERHVHVEVIDPRPS
jgi:hypothetical protein